MDRNTIIAIVLSVIVITVGMTIQTVFFAPELPVSEEIAEEAVNNTDTVLPDNTVGGITAAGAEPDITPFEVKAGEYSITFDPAGASVSSIKLNNHSDNGQPVELLFRDDEAVNAFMMYSGKGLSNPIDDGFYYTESRHSTLPLTIVTFTRDFISDDTGEEFTIEKSYAIPLNDEFLIQMSVRMYKSDGSPVSIGDGNTAYTVSVGPQIGPAFQSLSSNYDWRRLEVKYAEDKDKWLIDEEAAQTVRYIFKLCYDGLGPTQIAKKLKVEKVLTPTAYKAQKDGKLLPAEPYKWAQKTVAGILEKLEYIGHTENFKTTSKNYRSKKRVWNDKENRRIFEDTHPAIVDRHIFETVQEIRKHKHYKAAGIINIADEDCVALDGRLGMQNRKKKAA